MVLCCLVVVIILMIIHMVALRSRILKSRAISDVLSLVGKDIKQMVFVFDMKGNCVYNNNRINDYVGEKNLEEFVSSCFLQWQSKPEDDNMMWTDVYGSGENTLILDYNCEPITNKKGRRVAVIMFVSDRSNEMSIRSEKYFVITHDELTGLYRREYFFEMVSKQLKSNPDKKYYLVCTDIAEFKLYNELFGEEKGDEVLFTQANLLRKTSGLISVYGRITGDQFGMLIPAETFSEEAIVKYTKYLCDMFSNASYRMHVYLGIYEITDIDEPVSLMCDKARLSISSIKGEYSTIFSYFDESMLEASLYEQSIVGEFEDALAANEFCMYLQPQVEINGKVRGCEALVRWNHPKKGLIPPGKFIGIFEKTGLIWKLDKFVWEQAVIKLKKWQDDGRDMFPISVNISAKDFYYIDIYEEFVSLVEKYGINPSKLKLEITESVLLEVGQAQLDVIQKLRKYGFEVEIDDFGSGYSSLNMLKEIDFDVLKLDMGFLRNVVKEEKSWAIINVILNLAKELNLQVITEGVETKEQVDKLSELGCDRFQGFYFSKPMPVEEFEMNN